MPILFSSFLFIYVAYLLILLWKWNAIQIIDKEADKKPKVTVIIPVRNEAESIKDLLNDLDKQSYRNFEVLVVNDQSEDRTVYIVQDCIDILGIEIKLIELEIAEDFTGSHKKKAITQAVEKATGSIILCTDGDCSVGARWISEFVDVFEETTAMFVSGPVQLEPLNTILSHLQALELRALIATGAASIEIGSPNMCNGANMAFLKTAFYAVNGYTGIEHLASGDDEFLMQKIYQKYPEGIHFIKSRQAVVATQPIPSLKGLYYQRRRWAGKWRHHKNLGIKLLAMFIFFFHAAFIGVLFMALVGIYSWKLFCIQLLVKGIIELVFLKQTGSFFVRKTSFAQFSILEILYSFYVVFFGIAANFGKYKWKGRIYKS